MKILIVDNDPGILNALRVSLISAGHQAIVAGNGKQALKLIESSVKELEPFDLLVTELMMPGMDGLELIRQCRDLQPDLPSIVMTANAGARVCEDVLKLGRAGCVDKPFTPATLMNMIRKLIPLPSEEGPL